MRKRIVEHFLRGSTAVLAVAAVDERVSEIDKEFQAGKPFADGLSNRINHGIGSILADRIHSIALTPNVSSINQDPV